MRSPCRVIESYVHNGRIGVLVELGLQTLFTAATPEFKQLAKDLVLQVAAAKPASTDVLLDQVFVKDSSLTVRQVLANASHQLGEHIVVTRIVRWDTDESLGDTQPPHQPAAVVRLRKVP